MHISKPLLAQNLLQKRGILPKPARPIRRRHEEDGVLRFETRLLRDLQKVSRRDLRRIALIAARELPAQFERARIRRRRWARFNPHPPHRRAQQFDAAFRHGRNVDRFPGKPMVTADLPG